MNIPKRIISAIMALCVGTSALPMANLMPLTVAAVQDYSVVEADNYLVYHVYSDHVEVRRSYPIDESELAEELEIPAEIEGKPVTVISNLSYYPMRSITLPDTVTSIGNSSFSACDQLEEITIPSGVTEISYSAFSSCKALKKVVLPDGITKIDRNAFSQCSSLVSLEFPGQLEYLGENAFNNCTSLEEVTLPENLELIESQAFHNCTALQHITLPAFQSLKTTVNEWGLETEKDSLSLSAFDGCTSLSEFKIHSGSSCYSTVDGLLCNETGETLILVPQGLQADTYLLPGNITAINSNAFKGCSGIRKLCIPDSVTTLSEFAFAKMGSVEEIVLPDSLTILPSLLFDESSNLQRIHFPTSLRIIMDLAFCRTGFTELVIPDSVEKVDETAFTNMSSLEHLTFGKQTRFCDIYDHYDNEEEFEYQGYGLVLSGDTALKKITIPKENPYYTVREDAWVYEHDGTELYACSPGIITPVLRIPDGTKEIGISAMRNTDGFQEVILPAGIRELKEYCFMNSSLEKLALDDEDDLDELRLRSDCLRETPFLDQYAEEKGMVITENGILLSAPEDVDEMVIPANVRAWLEPGFGKFGGVSFAPRTIFEGNARFHDTNFSLPIENLIVKGDLYFEEKSIRFWDSLKSVTVDGNCTVELCFDDLTAFNDSITDWTVGGELSVAGALRGSITHLSYPRPEMHYCIGDNPDVTTSQADISERILPSEFDKYCQTASESIPTPCLKQQHVDYLQELHDGNGNCYALYNPGIRSAVPVYLYPEDPGAQPVIFSKDQYYFGCSAMDTDGTLYILWGKNTNVNSGEDSLVLCKYDPNGELLGECGIPVDFTRATNPFSSGNVSLVLTNGMAVFQYATFWNNERGQGSGVCAVDTVTMQEVRNEYIPEIYGNSIGTDNPQTFRNSYSRAISLIPTKYGVFGLDKKDSLYMEANIAKNGEFAVDSIGSTFYPYSVMFYDPDVSLCGLTASSSTFAFAGQSNLSPSGRRNAFVRILDQNLTSTADDLVGEDVVYKDDSGNEHITHNVIWLTDIPEDGEVGSVKLTTLGDGSYCAMWEQKIGEDGSVWYTVFDECGNRLRRPTKLLNARLSNTSVQPIADGTKLKWATVCDNVLTWYSVDLSDGGETVPVEQDPDKSLLGDVNEDGKIDAKDASDILVEYSKMSTGGASSFSDKQKTAANVNGDDKIDAKDASAILSYYSYTSTGGKEDIESFLKSNKE